MKLVQQSSKIEDLKPARGLEITFTEACALYFHLICEMEDSTISPMEFLNYENFAKDIDKKGLEALMSHPEFDMSYVSKYPEKPWDWKYLTLHGKMTKEEAIKLFEYCSKNKDSSLMSKLCQNFDRLMIQPWMKGDSGVEFIKKYGDIILNEDDKRYYLRVMKS